MSFLRRSHWSDRMNNSNLQEILTELRRLLERDSADIGCVLDGEVLPMYREIVEKERECLGRIESDLHRINTEMY